MQFDGGIINKKHGNRYRTNSSSLAYVAIGFDNNGNSDIRTCRPINSPHIDWHAKQGIILWTFFPYF